MDYLIDIGWKAVDLSLVESLQFLNLPHVPPIHKVDGDALSSKAAASSHPVDVVLSVPRQIKIDDHRHSLNIYPSRKEIGGNEHARLAHSEFPHYVILFRGLQSGMNTRDCEVIAGHPILKIVYSSLIGARKGKD